MIGAVILLLAAQPRLPLEPLGTPARLGGDCGVVRAVEPAFDCAAARFDKAHRGGLLAVSSTWAEKGAKYFAVLVTRMELAEDETSLCCACEAGIELAVLEDEDTAVRLVAKTDLGVGGGCMQLGVEIEPWRIVKDETAIGVPFGSFHQGAMTSELWIYRLRGGTLKKVFEHEVEFGYDVPETAQYAGDPKLAARKSEFVGMGATIEVATRTFGWSGDKAAEKARLTAKETWSWDDVAGEYRKGVPAPALSKKPETRCGWLENPTPGNFSLHDGEAEWEIASQGGYQAVGADLIPDLSRTQGYACACLTGETDATLHRMVRISKVKQKLLKDCRDDPALPAASR